MFRVGVERVQFGVERGDGQRVEHEVVQADADPGPRLGALLAGVFVRAVAHRLDGEQRPAGGVADLLGQAGAQAGQGLGRATGSSVVHGYAHRRYVGQDTLVSVLDDGAEHAVPSHQGVPGALQPVQVDVGAVELRVVPGAHAAEGEPGSRPVW